MEKTACLIVDVQQSVVSALPDGGEELTEKLSRLITWCRQQMVPLVYVRHDDGEDRISEIDSRIKPKESEIVIDKSYPSAFLETDLESWCSEQGITQLIVAGMMTEFCIDATIKSALSGDIRYWYRRDAVLRLIMNILLRSRQRSFSKRESGREDMRRFFLWKVCSANR